MPGRTLILVEVGLDNAMENNYVDFTTIFYKLSLDKFKLMFFQEIKGKNALNVYALCKKSTCPALEDTLHYVSMNTVLV